MKTLMTLLTIVFIAASAGAQALAPAGVPAFADRLVVQPPPPPPPPAPGGGRGRGVGPMRVPLESKAVKGAPYSAQIEIESIQMLSDGNRIVHRTSGRVYRDAAGRIRREEDQPSGQPTILIFDPEAGVSYSLDIEKRFAWKTTAPAATEIAKKLVQLKLQLDVVKKLAAEKEVAAAKRREPDGADVQRRREEEKRKAEVEAMAAKLGGGRGRIEPAHMSEDTVEGLGSRTMEGVRAEGIKRTITIHAGAIGNELPIKVVSEEWTSPELQVLVLTQHSDPRMGQSSYRMLGINRAEPNPTLFQVPSDYIIRETGIKKFDWKQ